MKPDDIVKAPCNTCGVTTKHRVVASRKTVVDWTHDESNPDAWPVQTDAYDMLECCGCSTSCLRYSSTFEPTKEVETHYYPPRVSRRPPKWLHDVPKPISALAREIYAAAATDSRRLAAMGTRAVLDMVVLDTVGDVGPFSAKLEALERRGFIGRIHREQLEAALDLGSAAAHRGVMPSPTGLEQMIDIVENLLETVYVLQRAVDELKRETPPRGDIR